MNCLQILTIPLCYISCHSIVRVVNIPSKSEYQREEDKIKIFGSSLGTFG